MNRIRIFNVLFTGAVILCLMPDPATGQGEVVPGRVPPGAIERIPGGAEADGEKLPDFDMGKFCYALGLDAARTANDQRTDIDSAELRKGIMDGLAGAGASSSYVYGLGLGRRLKEFGVTPDLDQYFAAVEDVIAGREPKVNQKDAQIQIFLFEREQLKKKQATNLAQSKVFLEQNAKRPGVTVVDTGWGKIQYQILRPAKNPDGAKPKPGDRLQIHYRGLFLGKTDWALFTSSEGGKPLDVLLGQGGLIRGLELGLQQMSPGANYRFFIPPELGFGKEGTREKIPPNVVLLFDVELLGFARGELKDPEFPGLKPPGS